MRDSSNPHISKLFFQWTVLIEINLSTKAIQRKSVQKFDLQRLWEEKTFHNELDLSERSWVIQVLYSWTFLLPNQYFLIILARFSCFQIFLLIFERDMQECLCGVRQRFSWIVLLRTRKTGLQARIPIINLRAFEERKLLRKSSRSKIFLWHQNWTLKQFRRHESE